MRSLICLTLAIATQSLTAQIWPIADDRFQRGDGPASWAQPTASGRVESALFGATRNNGHRFHEGIDIAPFLSTDRRGEAVDAILAVMPGTVRHVNTVAGNSSFGRYIVIEHPMADVPVYSLYAHLARVADGLEAGVEVEAGQRIGRMGRSAGGYSIPRQRAHLHLEIGLRLSHDFDWWYRERGFGSANHHGDFNGMNLTGFDPLPVLIASRKGSFTTFEEHIKNLPTAFTLRVATHHTPDFVLRYPRLMAHPADLDSVVAWVVDFTWFGLPKRWLPLTSEQAPAAREGDVAIVYTNPEAFPSNCSRTFQMVKGKPAKLTDSFKQTLRLLFDFRRN